MKKFATAVLASLVSIAAYANDPCAGLSATNEIYQCVANEYSKADAALNATWRSISSSYSRQGISNARYNVLVNAQKSWITLRDLDCKFAGMQMEGGSFEKVLVTYCLLNKTTERTRFLHDSVFGVNE